MSHPSKPFLKYAGGKQRLVTQLCPFFPAGIRLIEPFVGAGSLMLALDYPSVVMNDANHALMNVWEQCKRYPHLLIDLASGLFVESNKNRSAFEQLRLEFNANPKARGLRQAGLFLYLNRFGFNGLWRTNQRGQFNVPYGGPRSLPQVAEAEILAASKRLKSAQLLTGDFERVIELAGQGDVVYADPPYCGTHHRYTANPFSVDDHVRLRDAAVRAAERGAFAIISNSENDLTLELYKDAEIHRVSSRRSLSSKADTRGAMTELVAIYGSRRTSESRRTYASRAHL